MNRLQRRRKVADGGRYVFCPHSFDIFFLSSQLKILFCVKKISMIEVSRVSQISTTSQTYAELAHALTFGTVLELLHFGGAEWVCESGRTPLDHAASTGALPLACHLNDIMTTEWQNDSITITAR